NHKSQTIVSDSDVVVEVSAQIKRRLKPGSDLESFHRRHLLWNHRPLHIAREMNLVLQLALALDMLCMEASVDQSNAQVIGDVFKQPSLRLVERTQSSALECNHADR